MGQVIDDGEAPGLIPGDSRPAAYLTTEYLAALWDERSRQADAYRQLNPDDRKGIDRRQQQALAVLQAYRFLSGLEQQLGVQLALPVLGRLPG